MNNAIGPISNSGIMINQVIEVPPTNGGIVITRNGPRVTILNVTDDCYYASYVPSKAPDIAFDIPDYEIKDRIDNL